jgi:YHS domain-containing protein
VKDETMLRDPVCGVVLGEKTSKFKIRDGDETHYFCTCDERRNSKGIEVNLSSRLDRFAQAGNRMLSKWRRFGTVLCG